jgi:NhaA family Na+:H+ antiporter
MTNFLRRFSRTEAFSGLLVIMAAVAAVLWANLNEGHATFWHTMIKIEFGNWDVSTDVEHLIGEIAMSAFFLIVGLEIRRELASGHLTTRASRVAPIVAAISGTIVPAGIYLAFALPQDRAGWPIPTATDIALVIGVAGLLASKLHPATRVLLLSIAVLDDIIGIGLLALLSTGSLRILPALIAVALTAGVVWYGRHRPLPLFTLLTLWLVLLILLIAGGIHPTLSGVLVALAAPSRRPCADDLTNEDTEQPSLVNSQHPVVVSTAVERLELALLPWVSYLILPLFVLSHAGVTFDVANQTTLAVALGLALGKPTGLIGALLLGAKLRLLSFGMGVDTREIVVVGLLCGAGLTVSSLLASAALPVAGPAILGVLIGSSFAVIAAVVVALLPRRSRRN